jgi:hypothetical protein
VTASSSLRAADDSAAYQEALRALGDDAVRDFRIVEGLDYKLTQERLRRVSSTGQVRTNNDREGQTVLPFSPF